MLSINLCPDCSLIVIPQTALAAFQGLSYFLPMAVTPNWGIHEWLQAANTISELKAGEVIGHDEQFQMIGKPLNDANPLVMRWIQSQTSSDQNPLAHSCRPILQICIWMITITWIWWTAKWSFNHVQFGGLTLADSWFDVPLWSAKALHNSSAHMMLKMDLQRWMHESNLGAQGALGARGGSSNLLHPRAFPYGPSNVGPPNAWKVAL